MPASTILTLKIRRDAAAVRAATELRDLARLANNEADNVINEVPDIRALAERFARVMEEVAEYKTAYAVCAAIPE